MLGCSRQHLIDPGLALQWLLHQAQCSAARKSEARGLAPGHTVGQQGRARDRCGRPQAFDQVIFHATAGDRSDDGTVFAQTEQGAGDARRRSPGLDNRDEPDPTALDHPALRLGEDLQIKIVHGALF